MREPELSKEVMALAERASRLYLACGSGGVVLPGLPQSDVLPGHEASILDEAGLGISDAVARGAEDPAAEAVVDFMDMLSSALTVRETANVLGVSRSAVRARIRGRTLAAISEKRRYRVPRFQFHGHRLVPSFGRVYSATPEDLPLVVFYRWFIQRSPDLSGGRQAHERDLSPREWLLAGFDTGTVEKLAALL